MMAHKECCTAGDACKLIVGGLLGAGLALLLAPQTGKKTRESLAGYAKNVGSKANEAANDFAETLSDFVDSAGDRASELLKSSELTQDSKKALLAALEKGQEILEAQRKKLADMIG